MNSIRRRIAALVVCFLLASCGNLPQRTNGLRKPLTAELQVLCPQPVQPPASGEVDPVAQALKQMYDLYAICAGLTAERLKWDEQEMLR